MHLDSQLSIISSKHNLCISSKHNFLKVNDTCFEVSFNVFYKIVRVLKCHVPLKKRSVLYDEVN